MGPTEEYPPIRKGPKRRRALKVLKTFQVRQKAPRLPRRVLAVGGATILVAVIAWWLFAPAGKNAPQAPSPSPAMGDWGIMTPQSPAPSPSPDRETPQRKLAFIKAVRLLPPQPTRTDNLKAEVVVAADAPEGLRYTYLWKVNDRIVEEADGNTLQLPALKKGDHVAVTVTPHDGDTAGFAVTSPLVAIHGIAPSLELEIKHPRGKAGDPIELHLVSVAPDSTRIAFGLAAPRVPGMTIDGPSGKITWRRQPDQKGSFRFGASVEDDNGTKVTKVFDLTVK